MKKSDQLLLGLLLITIAFLTTAASFNFFLIKTMNTSGSKITGFASSNNKTGEVNFTQAGFAGLVLLEDAVDFGSGFFNSSCPGTSGRAYSTIESEEPGTNPNPSPGCWINTTPFLPDPHPFDNNLDSDFHVLENNGTTILNVTGIADRNAADFMYSIGGATSGAPNSSVIITLIDQNETNSCLGGITGGSGVEITNNTANLTFGVCTRLDFADHRDSLKIYYKLQIPGDIPAGVKEMAITYTGIAV